MRSNFSNITFSSIWDFSIDIERNSAHSPIVWPEIPQVFTLLENENDFNPLNIDIKNKISLFEITLRSTSRLNVHGIVQTEYKIHRFYLEYFDGGQV